MRNYFNYFTEIEERFQQRRGSILLLSTLDWALIETWRDAGIPIEAVLRGIDAAFDKYESRQKRGRMRRVNGLAWCAQAVMEASEELREASAGTAQPSAAAQAETGFEHERVASHLESCGRRAGSIGYRARRVRRNGAAPARTCCRRRVRRNLRQPRRRRWNPSSASLPCWKKNCLRRSPQLRRKNCS